METNPEHLPLIVKRMRQIEKTESIRHFARKNYHNVIEIDFVLRKQFKSIFDNGFEVDTILKSISLIDPSLGFLPGETLFFYQHMLQISPFSELEWNVFSEAFKEYMVIGGMPAIVNLFVKNKNYSGTLGNGLFCQRPQNADLS
jgi:hypothetical protein